MTRDADQHDWLGCNVAITGMNARPDNPGPGCAVARCLRHTPGFRGHIVGLGYGALETGLYLRESSDSGHLLLIAPVGAYNTTQSMQFIEYRPAVVLIHGNREVSLIRAAEDLELVCAAERLPAHLARAEAESAARVLPLRMAGG
jgi:hypothetical protein